MRRGPQYLLAAMGVVVGMALPGAIAGAQSTTTTVPPSTTTTTVVTQKTIQQLPTGFATNLGCGSDQTAILNSLLNSLPPGSTYNFPSNVCYTVNGTININKTQNLTINFNNAVFNQVRGGTNGGTDLTECPRHPALFASQNTNLSMHDLRVWGSYTGKDGAGTGNGGVHCEGRIGIELEANAGVTIDGFDVENISGDGFSLQFPTDIPNHPTKALNTNIVLTNSIFHNIGYVGLSVESVNGLMVKGDQFTHMGPEAIDFEYDIYSTSFTQGQATWAAQDNVTITQNVFRNYGVAWFTSLQGQTPGVQQQNVALTDNSLDSAGSVVEIKGTPPNLTTPRYTNMGLTITGNKNVVGAKSTSGGAITKKYAGSTATIANVSNVVYSNNSFPAYDGTANYFPNHPYLAALQANGDNGLLVQNNQFNGNFGVLHPNSGNNTGVVTCGNTYGVKGVSSDGACAAPTP